MFRWLRNLLSPAPSWLTELAQEGKRLEALRERDPDAYRREVREAIVRANRGIDAGEKP